ncbi:MAG: ABC transporter ATP-binding protein [Planctomycetota bacterium]|nr:ABC transporter ATP-binding protein [Planctomycetota bacterium]
MSDGGAEAPLRAEGLQRTFVDGSLRLEVLRGASLAVQAGEIAALVGKSGSGKSTLLHLLGLLDWPNGGRIFVDGAPTEGLSEKRRSRVRNGKIGFIFQHYFLLPDFNVLENVTLPARIAGQPEAAARARARELLDGVELGDRLRQMPLTLSGGERQRVAIARALALKPRVLLCDEPTGNLDPATGARIMALIFELARRDRMATLVVTHDPGLAAQADRILRLEDGRLHAGN